MFNQIIDNTLKNYTIKPSIKYLGLRNKAIAPLLKLSSGDIPEDSFMKFTAGNPFYFAD